jgi:hypothetical protein
LSVAPLVRRDALFPASLSAGTSSLASAISSNSTLLSLFYWRGAIGQFGLRWCVPGGFSI